MEIQTINQSSNSILKLLTQGPTMLYGFTGFSNINYLKSTKNLQPPFTLIITFDPAAPLSKQGIISSNVGTYFKIDRDQDYFHLWINGEYVAKTFGGPSGNQASAIVFSIDEFDQIKFRSDTSLRDLRIQGPILSEFTTPTGFGLGKPAWGGTEAYSGFIRSIMVADEVLSDAEIESVFSWNKERYGLPFHPMDLKPLVWLDPRDKSTMWQDMAATIPVTSTGDPVAMWVNKGYGAGGGTATQPVSASRPTWTDAGGGSIDASGTTQLSIPSRLPNPKTIAVWIGEEAFTGHKVGYRPRTSGNLSPSGFSLRRAGSGRLSVWSVDVDGVAVSAGNPSGSDRKGAMIIWQTNESLHLQSVDNQYDTFETMADIPSEDLIVGGEASTPDIRDVLIFDRVLNATERLNLLQWLEAQHGI